MLKDCIPDIFADCKQIKELFNAEQVELDTVYKAVESFINELYILKCSNTIRRYEDDYALEFDKSLSLEQRRYRIFAKKNQKLKPFIKSLESMLKNILGAREVKITEKDCIFTVRITTAELIENEAIAKEWFRNVRPAHFDFVFVNDVYREKICKSFTAVYAFEHKKFKSEVR